MESTFILTTVTLPGRLPIIISKRWRVSHLQIIALIRNTETEPQMRIAQLGIKNFRGIASAELRFNGHSVLIGDNNTGKSSVLEAIDLVLGPDRLSRPAPIDEHDFYAGRYLDADHNQISIQVEVVIVDLTQ
jgi:predicted ATPase